LLQVVARLIKVRAAAQAGCPAGVSFLFFFTHAARAYA
jgi:hypothetical protein